jgi:hypothetical protein
VPFVGEGYGEVLVQHLTQAPAAPSTIRGLIPPHVEQIVMKALEKAPQGRYPTMDEMMRAMADPVGYVEGHGGMAGFRQAMLMPSDQPMPQGGVRLTPSPMSPLTPVPGSISAIAAPGSPTTLGAAAGQVGGAPGSGKKIGIFVGIGVAVAAIAAAVFLLAGGGGGGKKDETTDNDTVAANADDDSTDTTKPDTTKPDTTKPDTTKPDTTKPDTTNPDTVKPDTTKPDTTNPDTTKPDTTNPDTTKPDTTKPDVTPVKEQVTITIDSSPSGAMVFVGNEKEPRGKTPYTFKADKGSGDLDVKLYAKRYKWEKRKVPTTSNQTLDIPLEKEKKSGGGGSHGSGGGDGDDSGGSDDTMNPFKKKKPT